MITSAKSSKSLGLDNISPAAWKLPELHDYLLAFCNDALINGNISEAWKTSSIIPIPKKGDLSKPGNYRGISLDPVAAKAYNKLLLNLISLFIDPLLRYN